MIPAPPQDAVDFRTRKGVNLLRNHLLRLLDADNYYQLDRFDIVPELDLAAWRIRVA